jgi:hypothetical protein
MMMRYHWGHGVGHMYNGRNQWQGIVRKALQVFSGPQTENQQTMGPECGARPGDIDGRFPLVEGSANCNLSLEEHPSHSNGLLSATAGRNNSMDLMATGGAAGGPHMTSDEGDGDFDTDSSSSSSLNDRDTDWESTNDSDSVGGYESEHCCG